MSELQLSYSIFFFNDPATTEIYTLSLHDALPIYRVEHARGQLHADARLVGRDADHRALVNLPQLRRARSEEHTSELQSHHDLVCRLLLEKKKTNDHNPNTSSAKHFFATPISSFFL